jgi:lipopolysaccharide/colanic/teichoic acid biosynthesis glycosyltransferase
MIDEGTAVTRDLHSAPLSDRASDRTVSQGSQRLFDIVVAIIALLCLIPLMLIIAVAVYLGDRGPIFFSQTRLGLHGKHFRLLKFRKFGRLEPKDGLPLTLADDIRLTRLGRVLEKTKLDELPQLWNVVRGDMALVGPRPESLSFADCFTGPFRALLEYKPGIFGPAQVQFRNESEYYVAGEDPEQIYRRVLFPTKGAIDLQYYGSRTNLQDLAWIGRGVLVVTRLSRVGRQPDRNRAGEAQPSNQPRAGLPRLPFGSGLDLGSMVRNSSDAV